MHVVVDSLHPDEVGPDLPVLSSLQADGTWHEQGRAVMASETLPHHVAMATAPIRAATASPATAVGPSPATRRSPAFTRQPAAVWGVAPEGAPSTSPPSTGGEPGDEAADGDDGDDGSLPATGWHLAPWVLALAALGLGLGLRARARPT